MAVEASAEELAASCERLEAGDHAVAIWPDGRAIIVNAGAPWPPGSTVWSGAEMLAFCEHDRAGRDLMRSLKRIGGVR